VDGRFIKMSITIKLYNYNNGVVFVLREISINTTYYNNGIVFVLREISTNNNIAIGMVTVASTLSIHQNTLSTAETFSLVRHISVLRRCRSGALEIIFGEHATIEILPSLLTSRPKCVAVLRLAATRSLTFANPGRPFVRYPARSPLSSMMRKGIRLPGTGRRPRQSRGSARPGGGTTALTARCTSERRDPLTRCGGGLAGWAQLEFRHENIDGDRGAIS
jgi:hypothetical protein